MSKFHIDLIREMLSEADQIRNMSVIAHVDHGKTTLTDSLIAKAGIIAGDEAGDKNFTHQREDEAALGITIKATCVTMHFESSIACEEGTSKRYIINLVDSPGHVDFSSEVTAALRATDGAVVVVDYKDGVKVQTETVLRQALAEKVKPVLVLNKIDKGILETGADAEAIYQQFVKVIESTNVIIATYEASDMGETQQVDPTKGTVGFASGKYGWGFTLAEFARVYAPMFKLSVEETIQKLWGDNYFDKKALKWRKEPIDDEGNKLPRAFCQFILEPIIRIAKNIMDGNKEAVWKMTEKVGVKLDQNEKELVDKDLFKKVFQKWLNCAEMLLEMVIIKLPSPKQAQKYRAAYLYEGPIDDVCGQAITNCDPTGPLMVYVSKMIPSKEGGRFYAFGRVFSGTVSTGQKVRIMGPKYEVGKQTDLFVKNVQRVALLVGNKPETVAEVPCGNTVALVGIDQCLAKQGTVSDCEEAHTIRAMKYSVSPVVKVAVKAKNPADLPKLIEGLKRLSKSDQSVIVTTEATGEHVIAGCGDLHIQTCLRDLAEYAKGCQFSTSEPIVTYKETILTESSQLCLAKSANKHNRLWAQAEPLGEELCNAIEDKKVDPRMDNKVLSKMLADQFNWDPNDGKKIWSFSPNEDGPNIMVDMTKGIQYMHEIKEHAVVGFNWAMTEGVLAGETLRGMRLNIKDANLISDSIHRGGGQIIPPARRVSYAAQLTAQPRFQEPVLLCEIQTSEDDVGKLYQILSQRRGNVFAEEPVPGTPLVIMKAYLPVQESFGFSELLREKTQGRAFPQMVFDHWETLLSDPLEAGSRAQQLCETIRVRKGLKPEVPGLENFHDKL